MSKINLLVCGGEFPSYTKRVFNAFYFSFLEVSTGAKQVTQVPSVVTAEWRETLCLV